MSFERIFSENQIASLKGERLFTDCLLPDMATAGRRQPSVFPAVRKNRVDFYYRGGKLFSYDGKRFVTHHKYASVLQHTGENHYIVEKGLKAITSFQEGYERIKENCALYAGVEASQVAELYSRYSCVKHSADLRTVVLDIEACFLRPDELEESGAGPGGNKKDRIDFVLHDTRTGMLRFFEAKDFSNAELRAEEKPRIVGQIERYKKQLEKPSLRAEILEAYKNHVEAINSLFSPKQDLPIPTAVDQMPKLLVFGFDEDQRKGRLSREVKRLKTEYGLHVYTIGDITSAKVDTVFSGGGEWR